MRIKGNRGQTHYDNEEGKEKTKSGQNLNKKSIQKGRGEKKKLQNSISLVITDVALYPICCSSCYA